jgi:hypothetical protein
MTGLLKSKGRRGRGGSAAPSSPPTIKSACHYDEIRGGIFSQTCCSFHLKAINHVFLVKFRNQFYFEIISFIILKTVVKKHINNENTESF